MSILSPFDEQVRGNSFYLVYRLVSLLIAKSWCCYVVTIQFN